MDQSVAAKSKLEEDIEDDSVTESSYASESDAGGGEDTTAEPAQMSHKGQEHHGEVDFGVLEGFLQESMASRTTSSEQQAALHFESSNLQTTSNAKPSPPPPPVGGQVADSVPVQQAQGEALQKDQMQASNKENKELVLFTWKDAKEFVTMSWHLTNCKICREHFETWKGHAIKEHDVKPVVHKLNAAGNIEQKLGSVVQKGILTQNVSNNQRQVGASKVAQQKKGNTTASVVLKHLTTKYKPKTDAAGSSTKGQYHCGLCNLHYKTEPELKLHLNIHAGQRIAFKCQKCDRIFLHQGMLQKHMSVHKVQNTICKICGRKFPDVQKARRHRYTHGKKQTYKCSKCGKTYTSMQSLRIHQRTHTGDGMLSCKFCGKKFPSKFSLNSHERIHTGEKPYKCVYCNEHFITHSAMSYHKQIHTGFKYMCQHCGKGYRDKSNLREHERIHTGEKPFKCDDCPEAFTTAALLKYHRQVHTGERYECEICKKRYRSRGILNTHMRSHSDERPFICRFCGKGFREKATLKTHEKGVHLGVKFMCEICKREFTQRSALKTHEKGVHGMHGHAKSKKAGGGQRRRPRPPDNSAPVEVIPVAIKSSDSIPPPPPPPPSHTSEQVVSSTGYHIETEFVNSTLVPIIRQGPPDPYDQVSAAHATTHPPYPMSSSDFHTMVDSLIQFSKDH
ncbi:uncharacterized protein [Amphiura filiformis]|uniref:uncharacterized protein n=1 Tax=Amphiura filiformis TaxID=82378 RepID=UPI003B20E3ED